MDRTVTTIRDSSTRRFWKSLNRVRGGDLENLLVRHVVKEQKMWWTEPKTSCHWSEISTLVIGALLRDHIGITRSHVTEKEEPGESSQHELST